MPLDYEDVRRNVVRGQYAAGHINGVPVQGYREEPGVNPHSMTETFVALQLDIDNWRWAGVPFYLRTGKRMTPAHDRDRDPVQKARPLRCSATRRSTS